MTAELILIPDTHICKFTKNGLMISEIATKEEWLKVGEGLRFIEGAVQFWIGDWARFGEKRGFYTDSSVYDEIEKATGYERKTLCNFKNISEQIESSRRREDLSFGHHAEVAPLSPEKQKEYLDRAVEEKLSVRELREEIRKDKIKILQDQGDLPQKKYRIFYADPPWSYGNSMPSYFTEQANYYPLMQLGELERLPIKELAEENAVLFLWVTSPILKESFQVIDAWGFEYKTSFVWDKVKHNMGHYNSVRHEFLLVCVRGSCTPEVNKLFDSVVVEERTEHSVKPKIFREIIDFLYPHGNRIELFAREKVNGWDAFGNQLS
ncbi:MAG: MT-A70 family methyltransferase [Acidobacteriia bacterium]|nr:MT-A70 family methyltransferase [Terriglobia bacterium]